MRNIINLIEHLALADGWMVGWASGRGGEWSFSVSTVELSGKQARVRTMEVLVGTSRIINKYTNYGPIGFPLVR